MAEPGNLVVEHLRAIRGDMAKMADSMRSLSVEKTALRQHLAGVVTLQKHDHGEVAAINHPLDVIERGLNLRTDVPVAVPRDRNIDWNSNNA